MNTYETINHVLVHLFNEIWELEEKAIITEEYKDISNNDMHIIELGEGSTMSVIAKKTEYYRRITYDIDEQSCE